MFNHIYLLSAPFLKGAQNDGSINFCVTSDEGLWNYFKALKVNLSISNRCAKRREMKQPGEFI
jgi:hypothetical protein